MVILCELFFAALTLRFRLEHKQAFTFIRGQVDVELKEGVYYLVNVLVDSDQVILDQVTLP